MLRFFKKFLALRKKRKALMLSPIIIKNETSVLDVDLLDKQTSEQDKKTVRQYTKTLITALTICSCVWISLSYVMSAYALIVYGDSDPLSNLSERVCACTMC